MAKLTSVCLVLLTSLGIATIGACEAKSPSVDTTKQADDAGALAAGPVGGPQALELDLRRFETELDQAAASEDCVGPRPPSIGCKVTCKPCTFYVCVDGEWQPEQLDFPDELCSPKPGLGGVPSSACPRTGTGFCPAECSVCF